MPDCSLTVDTVADELKKAFWSREPYRRVVLRLTVRNDSDSGSYLHVNLEVLLPEAAFVGVPGGDAAWNPSHSHELEGQDFLVWSTFGGFGRFAAGGVEVPPSYSTSDLLVVDLKPAMNSIRMFWRLFERETDDPSAPFHPFQLELKPYVPSI